MPSLQNVTKQVAEDPGNKVLSITHELTKDGGSIDRLSGQFSDAIGGALDDETAVVEQQGTQASEFLAASGAAGTTVQTAWHDVAVAGVLGTNG